jgi:hypothetical protein
MKHNIQTSILSCIQGLWVTYRWGIDWISDLLTAYRHHSEIHVITTLPLIYTLYSSLGHTKSSRSSLVVSWQRIYNSLSLQQIRSLPCTA